MRKSAISAADTEPPEDEDDGGWDDEGAAAGVEVGMGCVAGGEVEDGDGVGVPLSFGMFAG